MPEQTDVRHSFSAKVIVRAVLVIALLTALVWWVPYGPSLIHLLGAGLQRRLTIPVFSIGTQAVTPISLLKALLFLGFLAVLSNGVRKLLYRRGPLSVTLAPGSTDRSPPSSLVNTSPRIEPLASVVS
jgi:small-conductance mechanosensitive channel